MHVLITNQGDHDAPHEFSHYMVVDGHGLLLDLDGMRNSIVDPGSLTDPTIKRVEWGPIVLHGQTSEAGVIIRQDGSRQGFFDRELLKPYLAAYNTRRLELAREQAEYEAAEAEKAAAAAREAAEQAAAELARLKAEQALPEVDAPPLAALG